jgi:hypothetical protein
MIKGTIISQFNNFSKRDRYLFFILTLFSLFGLITKLFMSLNADLDSDQVLVGIASMEIWKHGNWLLNDFYFTSSYPSIYSDIIPFHLIPQVFTNFSPDALRITCFFIFVFFISAFTMIIFYFSKNMINSAVFFALMANMFPISYFFYGHSLYHVATAFFTAVFLLFLFWFDYENTTWKNSLIFFLFIVLFNLILFSDSIILVWLAVPYAIYYIFFNKKRSSRSNLYLLILSVTLGITFVYKNYFIPNFISISNTYPLYIKNIQDILTYNIPLYIKGIFALTNGNLFALLENPGIADYAGSLIFLIAIMFTLLALKKGGYQKYKPLLIVLVLSALIISAIYLTTSYCIDFGSSRYLIFAATSLIAVIALGFSSKNKVFVASVLLILLFGAASNAMYISDLKNNPNSAEYELITYLQGQNLSYGWGDYWDSNIITYLSDEKIIIRPMMTEKTRLVPFDSLTSGRWYTFGEINTDKIFIVVHTGIWLKKEDMDTIILTRTPEKILENGEYVIYVFPAKTS